MLSDKIEITEEICTIIKNKREEIGISARDLSIKYLGKSQGYISSLENGRVKYLKRKDIIKLFEVLYNIDENSSINKIQDILNVSRSIMPNELTKSKNFDIAINSPHKVNANESYKTIEDPTEKVSLKDLMDNIKLGFETIYKKKPDFTISTLKHFVVSLHFDLGFMMVILRTPFFIFEGLNHDERQTFLNEMAESFNKFALISKEHMDEQKKNKTNKSEDNSSLAGAEDSQDFSTDSDDSDQT